MSITSTVSTLQIYVSTLKLSSALPVPLIFIPCIDKKNVCGKFFYGKTI